MRVCKTCSIEKSLEDFETYKYKNKIYNRLECKECRSMKAVTYHYGISLDEAIKLKSIENCQICKKYLERKTDRYIDHDHETGEIRGVLCNRCNTCLQVIENDLYLQMIKYLNK